MRRVLASFFLLCLAGTVLAQQQPAAPALLYIHEEVAAPSKIADYERTTKEFGAMMRGAGVAFHYEAFSTEDFHYYFVMPMKSAGDVDKIMQLFMAELPQKVGKEKMTDLMRRSGATMHKTNEWIVLRRDDLSYVPAKPRLKPEEIKAHRWEFYYLKPGMEDLVDQIAAEWKAASAAAQSGDAWTLFQSVVGGDLPLVVVAAGGKDIADVAARNQEFMASLGEKGQALIARTFQIVRKYEVKYGWSRPDLSNPAPPAK